MMHNPFINFSHSLKQIFLDVQIIEDSLSRIFSSTQPVFFDTRFNKLTTMYEELRGLLDDYGSRLKTVVVQQSSNSTTPNLGTDLGAPVHPPRPSTPTSMRLPSLDLTPRISRLQKFRGFLGGTGGHIVDLSDSQSRPHYEQSANENESGTVLILREDPEANR